MFIVQFIEESNDSKMNILNDILPVYINYTAGNYPKNYLMHFVNMVNHKTVIMIYLSTYFFFIQFSIQSKY